MNSSKLIFIICLVLIIIGGLNWGLYAIDPSYNLVSALFGTTMVASTVYLLIAVAAITAVLLSLTNQSDIYSA